MSRGATRRTRRRDQKQARVPVHREPASRQEKYVWSDRHYHASPPICCGEGDRLTDDGYSNYVPDSRHPDTFHFQASSRGFPDHHSHSSQANPSPFHGYTREEQDGNERGTHNFKYGTSSPQSDQRFDLRSNYDPHTVQQDRGCDVGHVGQDQGPPEDPRFYDQSPDLNQQSPQYSSRLWHEREHYNHPQPLMDSNTLGCAPPVSSRERVPFHYDWPTSRDSIPSLFGSEPPIRPLMPVKHTREDMSSLPNDYHHSSHHVEPQLPKPCDYDIQIGNGPIPLFPRRDLRHDGVHDLPFRETNVPCRSQPLPNSFSSQEHEHHHGHSVPTRFREQSPDLYNRRDYGIHVLTGLECAPLPSNQPKSEVSPLMPETDLSSELVFSRLGRNVGDHYESSSIDLNSCSSHVLSRLGPRQERDSPNSYYDGADIPRFSDGTVHHECTNSSVLSRLGPEMDNRERYAPQRSEQINVNDDSHTSSSMESHFHQKSYLRESLSSRTSNSPSVLDRLGEQPLEGLPSLVTNFDQLSVSEQQYLPSIPAPTYSQISRPFSSSVYDKPSLARHQPAPLQRERKQDYKFCTQPATYQQEQEAVLTPTLAALPFSDFSDDHDRLVKQFSSAGKEAKSPREVYQLPRRSTHSVQVSQKEDHAHQEKITSKDQRHVLSPIKPPTNKFQKSLSTPHEDNIQSLATLVIGAELTNHLDRLNNDGSSLLFDLFTACEKVGACLSKKRRMDPTCNFPIILNAVSTRFKGFFTGTLNSSPVPANSKLLFTKELGHLRDTCGRNVIKWRKCVKRFISLADSIPDLVQELFGAENDRGSLVDGSTTPPPLMVVDIGSDNLSTPRQFVGYGAQEPSANRTYSEPTYDGTMISTSKHSSPSSVDTVSSSKARTESSPRKAPSLPQPNSAKDTSSPVLQHHPKVQVSSRKENVQSSPKKGKQSPSLPLTCPIREKVEKSPMSSPAGDTPKQRTKQHILSSEVLADTNDKLSTLRSRSSMTGDISNIVMQDPRSTLTEPVITSMVAASTCCVSVLESLSVPSTSMALTTTTKSPKPLSSTPVPMPEPLPATSTNEKSELPLAITSAIPVHSVEKTAEGLKSLLDIVASGIVQDILLESNRVSSGNITGPPMVSESQSDNAIACTAEQPSSGIYKAKQTHLVPQSREIAKERSLSPGEIVSSPSPSPPPYNQSSSQYSRRRSRSQSPAYRRPGRTRDYHQLRSPGDSQRRHGRSSIKRRQYSRRSRSPSHSKHSRSPSYSRRSRSSIDRQTKVKKGVRDRELFYRRSTRDRVRSKVSSGSEEELELLDLRKQALISMIQEDADKISMIEKDAEKISMMQKDAKKISMIEKGAEKIKADVLKPQHDKGKVPKILPSKITHLRSSDEKEVEESVGTQDNFEMIDMEVCDSGSDSLVRTPECDTVICSQHANKPPQIYSAESGDSFKVVLYNSGSKSDVGTDDSEFHDTGVDGSKQSKEDSIPSGEVVALSFVTQEDGKKSASSQLFTRKGSSPVTMEENLTQAAPQGTSGDSIPLVIKKSTTAVQSSPNKGNLSPVVVVESIKKSGNVQVPSSIQMVHVADSSDLKTTVSLPLSEAGSSTIATKGEQATACIKSAPKSSARSTDEISPMIIGDKIAVEPLSSDDTASPQARTPSPSSFAVKILPSNEKTWSIEPIHISPHDGSDSEDSDKEIDRQPSKPRVPAKVDSSDISQLLLQAKRAAECKQTVAPSAPSPTPTITVSKTSPLLLPTPKKKEYLQLKMRLEMHERKKQLKRDSKRLLPPSKAHVSSTSARMGAASVQHTTKKSFNPRHHKQSAKAKKSHGLRTVLAGFEQELCTQRSQHEKDQTLLGCLTDQLTDCEVIIEESELKLSALETQLQRLQMQIKSTRATHDEASDKKDALKAKVRTVKESLTRADKRIKEINAGISRTKDSIAESSHSISTKPASEFPCVSKDKALLSLERYRAEVKGPAGNSVPPTKIIASVPEVLIEPVSGCESDVVPAFPPTVIEVEQISDSEIVRQTPVSNPIIIEAVSDTESGIINCDKVQSDGSSSAASLKVPQRISSTDASSGSTKTPLSFSRTALTLRSSPAQLLPRRCLVSTKHPSLIVEVTQRSSGPPNIAKDVCASVIGESHTAETTNSQHPALVRTSLDEIVVDNNSLEDSASMCNASIEQAVDEQWIPASEIFCSGTSNLFTLGFDVPPEFVVPVNDLRTLYSLQVEPGCLSQLVLKDMQERLKPSMLAPEKNTLLTKESVTVTRLGDIPIGTPKSRSRKQKKPLKLSPEVKFKWFYQEENRGPDTTQPSHQLETHMNIASQNPSHCSIQDDSEQALVEGGKSDDAANRKRPLEETTCTSLTAKRSRKCNANESDSADSTVGSGPNTCSRVTPVLSKGLIDQALLVLQQSFKQTSIENTSLTVHQVKKFLSRSSSICTHISTMQQFPLAFSVDQSLRQQCSVKLPSDFMRTTRMAEISNETSEFAAYTSPLLSFSSYLLSPSYRQHEKLHLGSVTYSNKLDPKQILCKFEMLGVCKDPKCTAQHVRSSMLSPKEIVVKLVSNAPQVAECTSSELDRAEAGHPVSRLAVVNKLSTYASSVVKRYSPKLSNEEIYKLTAHEVNQAREAVNTTNKQHFVSFTDRLWMTGAQKPGTETPLPSVSLQDFDFLSLRKESSSVHLEPHHSSDVQRSRYCSPKSIGSKAKSVDGKHNVGHWLEVARDLIENSKYTEALTTLERALKEHNESLELWVCLLRLHSHLKYSKKPQTTDKALRDVCSRAVNATLSYAVILECIRIGVNNTWRQEWIVEGTKMLVSVAQCNATTSHQCVELLINSVLLNVSLGKLATALGTMEAALFGTTGKQSIHEFEGLCSHLTVEDRQLACLCLLHLAYWRQLPPCTANMQVPTQIVTKGFTIKWDTSKQLSSSEYKRMCLYFQECLHLLGLKGDLITADMVSVALLSSMVGFEVTHGDYQKAFVEIERLADKVPSNADMWLLYARTVVLVGQSPRDILTRAITACPRSTQLYYFAARHELSSLSTDTPGPVVTGCIQKAIGWLDMCVRAFYKECTMEPLLLYRKLLGQLVPYDLKSTFIDDLDPKELNTQLAALWMCYCFLVELTPPTSTSSEYCHQSPADAYESAVHSILDREGSMSVWVEYLSHLRFNTTRVLSNQDNLTIYLACVKRCLLAVDHTLINPYAAPGQADCYKDYTFHNQVIESVLEGMLCTPSQKLSLLQNFDSLLPNNTNLIAKVALSALEQEIPSFELAQSLLASHLAKSPYNASLWRMAASVEIKLGHSREARWMYQQATNALPHCLSIWTDAFLFELRLCLEKPKDDPSSLSVTVLLSRALECGVDLYLGLSLADVP